MPNDLLTPSAANRRADTHAAPPHVPLAVATRGDAVDAIHYGSVAVVDRDGSLLYAAGDPGFLIMTRSALKPFEELQLTRL